MNKSATLQFIKERQRHWAASRGIAVDANGRVLKFEDNFFATLHAETKEEINEGDGGELGSPEDVGKMYSLWSSSALACNVFDHWREQPLATRLDALDVQDSGYETIRLDAVPVGYPVDGVQVESLHSQIVHRYC